MKIDHGKLWGRVIPLYLLVALPVVILGPLYLGITGPVFLAGFVINWIWAILLFRFIDPIKEDSAPHR